MLSLFMRQAKEGRNGLEMPQNDPSFSMRLQDFLSKGITRYERDPQPHDRST
ncbi:MAG: hypothetical protein LH702_21555 [Phormidesmis sp. CAN_BIN44]|nr:hypothetical protein [Phormidesmis sp. CAN_BIN44]